MRNYCPTSHRLLNQCASWPNRTNRLFRVKNNKCIWQDKTVVLLWPTTKSKAYCQCQPCWFRHSSGTDDTKRWILSNCFCQPCSVRCREMIISDREISAHCGIGNQTFLHLPVRNTPWVGDRSQTTGENILHNIQTTSKNWKMGTAFSTIQLHRDIQTRLYICCWPIVKTPTHCLAAFVWQRRRSHLQIGDNFFTSCISTWPAESCNWEGWRIKDCENCSFQ